MAVVAVDDNNTRREDMEGAVSGTTNIGAGAGPGAFDEAVYEGAQSWGRKIGGTSSLRGFFVTITTIDMTAAANAVCLFKGLLVNKAVITSEGMRHRIGSSTSNYFEYIVADDGTRTDINYPPTTDWLISPVDPNVAAWRDLITTAPTLTTITEMGISGAVTVLTVNQNIIFDAIDFSEGLFLVGGDGGSTDGTFQDFVDYDEGAGSTTVDRGGHVTTKDGIIYVFGKLVIGRTSAGTSTLTEFTDSLKTIVFPGGRVDTGWNELEIDLATASSFARLDAINVVGRGRTGIKRWFDSSADEVDGTNEEIDIVGHGFLTGDTVLYSAEGGTAVTGLTDATEYFVNAVTVDSIALYAMTQGRDDAYTDTTRVGLTAAGTGQQHSLTRTPVTVPDITVTGTTGADFTPANCNLISVGTVTFTSKAAMSGGQIAGAQHVILAQGTMANVTVGGSFRSEGEALVTTPDPADITGCPFTASANGGHAVEGTAIGSFGWDNTVSGYGGASDQTAEEFNASTDVDGGLEQITITGHPYTDGDAAYYDDQGGTTIVGLTDQARYYVNSIDANTVSLHVTRADAVADANRVGLTAGSSETHALRSADAGFLNSSGGLITLSKTGGSTPSVRNTAGSSTVVSESVTITVTVKDNGGNLLSNVRVIVVDRAGPTELMNELTVSGVATEAFNGSTPVDVDVEVRDGDGGGTNYFPKKIPETVSASGLTITVTLDEDPHNATV